MPAIDLNSDLGEVWKGAPTADDEAMFGVVSSANIACGLHAGDPATMRLSVARAARFGVAIGAHPSYDDRDGFGRREVDLPPGALRDLVARQLDALAEAGADIRYVKPHGALYNRVVTDADQARAVAAAVAAFGPVPLMGLGGAVALAAAEEGVPFVREAFLDRGYTREGTLVARTQPGALLSSADEVAERAVRLVREGTVMTVEGESVAVDAVSLCVHGDTPSSVAMARAVRAALEAGGVEVRAPW